MSGKLYAQSDTPATLLREAADWFVRIHAEEVTTQDLGAWQLWLAQAPENRRAFQNIEDLWRDAGEVQTRSWPLPKELSDDHYRGQQPVEDWLTRKRAARVMHSWRRPLAIAATVAVLAISAGLVFWLQAELRPVPDVASLATTRAEERQVSLSDGSRLTLGAQSKVDIDLSRTARNVSIDSGEAFFKVAREQRPFVVHAGQGTITAIGTAFNVRHLDGRIVVTVAEGRVKVDAGRDVAYVSAGEQLAYGAAARAQTVRSVDPAVATSWRDGKLKYLNEPLRFVIADVNRYASKRVVIADPAVGDLLYTGTILPDELEDWLTSIREAFPVDVREEPETAVLSSVPVE
jgi:transmembrane sensor